MSAIAGAVDLHGRPLDGSLLEALTTLAAGNRADARGCWHEGAVGLGHVLAAVTPESCGEAQPLRDPGTGCVIVFDGRLDNRAELDGCLAGSPLPRSVPTDAAYTLAGYLQWGVDVVDHLIGDFALAIWDPRARQLMLARDPLGTRPCYYSHRPDRLTFASTLEQILNDSSLPRELDEDAVTAYLTGDEEVRGQRTCYRHVRSLPGGHQLTLRGDQSRLRRYWHWPAQPPPPRPATRAHAEEFRELFTEAVRCRLRSSAPVGLLLSGGLDSSAVAAVVGHPDRQDGAGPLRSYSLVFDQFLACDERNYSIAAAAHHRLPQTFVPGDECWALSHVDEWLPVFTDPYFLPYHGIHFKMLGAARLDGVRTILMGHGGDHLLTGSARYLSDWLLQGRWSDLHQQVAAHARLTKRSYPRTFAADVLVPLMPDPVRRRLKQHRKSGSGEKPWLPADLQHPPQRQETNSRDNGRSAWWYSLRRQWDRFGQDPNQAYLDRLARLFGLEVRQPFLDVRLIDFVLRVPPEALYRDGTPKLLLREALGDLLPPVIRTRRSRGSLSPLIEFGLRRNRRAFVEALLEDSELEQRGYILAEPWKAAIQTFLQGDNRHFWSYWRTLSLEMWLRASAGRLPSRE
jgi:asparagine synthase (glutamine-hydrolysing)